MCGCYMNPYMPCSPCIAELSDEDVLVSGSIVRKITGVVESLQCFQFHPGSL